MILKKTQQFPCISMRGWYLVLIDDVQVTNGWHKRRNFIYLFFFEKNLDINCIYIFGGWEWDFLLYYYVVLCCFGINFLFNLIYFLFVFPFVHFDLFYCRPMEAQVRKDKKIPVMTWRMTQSRILVWMERKMRVITWRMTQGYKIQARMYKIQARM